MMSELNLKEVLEHIDPAMCDYNEWAQIGMALHHEGYPCSVWEDWSARDAARFHDGECEKKWRTFGKNGGEPVTGGTIVAIAKTRGWRGTRTDGGTELDWSAEIGSHKDDLVVVDKRWIEREEITPPVKWDPAAELITYLETLFDSTDNVGYVTESWEKDGRYLPTKGSCDRTAGELIAALGKCGGDIGKAVGDYNEACGAWIRFNPLDGKGVKNENVTDYRYALVESDTMDIAAQNAILRELELPIACLVHSGKKSLHAIVRIEAGTYDEYRKRVDFLYEVCQKNGMQIDRQNRNPSRLSRMPGAIRNGEKQFLVDTNIGKASWAEWKEWIESVNDDLPDEESMADAWEDLPALAPELIGGVLRQGHKMLVAGPSKAGKSFALIELCCAIAEGRDWLGFPCAQGRVLYVNLELDRASCLHRFKDVYKALGWAPKNLQSLDIWNLRGHSAPMDKLAPKLIRRAAKKNYIAIVIDPIYKVITGDENSADQMAAFCNQFDKICTELGTAVIYCHHHSKGAQGGKRSMDRASGSGVFARDPDALVDIIELEITEAMRKQERHKAICATAVEWLKRWNIDVEDLSQDSLCSVPEMVRTCELRLTKEAYHRFKEAQAAAEKLADTRTAWRIEGTLREFARFAPVNLWFEYPVHRVDTIGSLGDLDAAGETPAWRKNFDKKKSPEKVKADKRKAFDAAFEACAENGEAKLGDMAEYLGLTSQAVKNRVEKDERYWRENGVVGRKA